MKELLEGEDDCRASSQNPGSNCSPEANYSVAGRCSWFWSFEAGVVYGEEGDTVNSLAAGEEPCASVFLK